MWTKVLKQKQDLAKLHTRGESAEIPHGKVEESINVEYKFQGKWVGGTEERPAQKLIGKF